jgi:4-hydroxybenzoate polyprenyltransferase
VALFCLLLFLSFFLSFFLALAGTGINRQADRKTEREGTDKGSIVIESTRGPRLTFFVCIAECGNVHA